MKHKMRTAGTTGLNADNPTKTKGDTEVKYTSEQDIRGGINFGETSGNPRGRTQEDRNFKIKQETTQLHKGSATKTRHGEFNNKISRSVCLVVLACGLF